jgi:hypothetical protein
MPNNFWMKELDEGIRSSITQKTDRARRIERGIKYDKACPLKLVDEALDISNDEKEDMTWRLHATTMAAMGAARIDNWELVEWCREQLAEGIQPDEDGEAILGDKYRLQLLAKVDKLLKAYKSM